MTKQWPSEMRNAVRVNFHAGLNDTAIAKKITEMFGVPVTRIAIVGQRYRMGLQSSKKKNLYVGQIQNQQMRELKKEPITDPVEGDANFAKRKPWQLPERGQCKYIHGDTFADDAFICQNSANSGGNYCAEHHKITCLNSS